MVLTDATNVTQEFPLTGFERIEFYFRSPQTPNGYNFSVLNGHPMFVYSIKNRQELSLNAQIYQIKFMQLAQFALKILHAKHGWTKIFFKYVCIIAQPVEWQSGLVLRIL